MSLSCSDPTALLKHFRLWEAEAAGLRVDLHAAFDEVAETGAEVFSNVLLYRHVETVEKAAVCCSAVA